MTKATVLKSVMALVGAGVAAYCGQLVAPVLVLLGVMLLDYITGMIKAYMKVQLSSRIGLFGILKKLCYMAMVAVGAGVDYLLRGALVQAGIDLHIKLFFGLLVAIWLIINELISILENLAVIGVPGFPRLEKILKRLKNTLESGNDAEGGSAK